MINRAVKLRLMIVMTMIMMISIALSHSHSKRIIRGIVSSGHESGGTLPSPVHKVVVNVPSKLCARVRAHRP